MTPWKEMKLNYLTEHLDDLTDQLEELETDIEEKSHELEALELKNAYLSLVIKALEKEIEELKE